MLEHVGQNLRRIRRDRDLTQTQLARLAGIRQQKYSDIERGKRPALADVDRLARILAVHPNELLRTPLDSTIGQRTRGDVQFRVTEDHRATARP